MGGSWGWFHYPNTRLEVNSIMTGSMALWADSPIKVIKPMAIITYTGTRILHGYYPIYLEINP